MSQLIYWDHNATAPLEPEVAALLGRAYQEGELLGNAASLHGPGRRAEARLWAARAAVAESLRCGPKEIVFVSSGSEANALALKGAFLGRAEGRRRRIVSSRIEHPAVLFALEQLKGQGAEVVLVPPGEDGRVSVDALAAELTDDTLLCSLMWANNETGVLQPVREAAALCQRRGILFHTDAVQAARWVGVSLEQPRADLLSLSGHKLGAPPGVGVLAARRGVPLAPLIPGHQEGGRRGGTAAVVLVEALARALALGRERTEANGLATARVRDAFEARVLEKIPGVSVNGRGARLPNTTSLLFRGADGEALLAALDLSGISVSAGAACASGTLKPSHVLTAQGLTSEDAKSSLRFSLGPDATMAQAGTVVEALAGAVARARQGSRAPSA